MKKYVVEDEIGKKKKKCLTYIIIFQENSSEKVPTTDAFSIDRGHLNDSSHFMSLVNKLTENITYINNSLNSEIQLMKEEHSRDHVSNVLFSLLKTSLNHSYISNKTNIFMQYYR